MQPRVGSNRRQKLACPPWELPVRPKIPSNERKCRCQALKFPPQKPPVPPQSQPQREKMLLSGTDFAAVDTARPPQTQPQRIKMPLLEVDSPAVRAASPPEFSQQRMKMPLPEIEPSTMGAAYLSHSQPQRREMPLPETQTLAPPIAESSPPSQPPTLRCRLLRRVPPCPTPLAALCYCRPQTSLQRRLASFAALAYRGRLILSWRYSAGVCNRHSSALQWSGALDCRS